MSENELRKLSGNGLVEIGAHSLTHPALSALPPALQAHELGASKARLEDVLGTESSRLLLPAGTEFDRRSATGARSWLRLCLRIGSQRRRVAVKPVPSAARLGS